MNLGSVARAFSHDQERRIIDLLRRILELGVAERWLRTIDCERVAYLVFHLGSVLVERETSGAADYPFDEIISVMDDVFARGIGSAGSRPAAGSSLRVHRSNPRPELSRLAPCPLHPKASADQVPRQGGPHEQAGRLGCLWIEQLHCSLHHRRCAVDNRPSAYVVLATGQIENGDVQTQI